MKPYPFSVFKRADRACYSVSFKDQNGKYLPPVSTGKKNETEAMQAAFKMLSDGILRKEKPVTVQDLSLINAARKINTGSEAEIIINEFKRSGLVKNYILNDTPQAEDFISFLKTFWDWDISPYIREKLRKCHGIHRMHCIKQGQAVALYWEDFFKGRFLGDITANDIDEFITFMGTKDISASRKNVVIMAGTKPLRWAFSKGKISGDPTRGHLMFSGEERKRNILTPTAAAAAFRVEWRDDMAKLANMLASVTGMRNGEIIALRFQDIGSDCLYVRSSWNGADKIKLPKNNETRTVEITFPYLINALVHLARQNPWGVSPDSFVFWSEYKKGVPNRGRIFVSGLREALMKIGFTEEEAAKYDFHGWRHFYTSYMAKKLDKKLLKSQTGHLTDDMINHYSDHETVGDRELIQTKQRETFAGLIPDQVLMLEYNGEKETSVA
jgi:integrase